MSGCAWNGAVGQGASSLIARNVKVQGRRTSVRLESRFWRAIEEICAREDMTVHDLCSLVARDREERSLAAGVRVFVLEYFRAAATERGHRAAGHGHAASFSVGRPSRR